MKVNIAVTKPTGRPDWDIAFSLPMKRVYVSTPDLKWGLAFVQELLIIAAANRVTRTESEASPTDGGV
jgi:hypothetical protein